MMLPAHGVEFYLPESIKIQTTHVKCSLVEYPGISLPVSVIKPSDFYVECDTLLSQQRIHI